MIGIPDSIPVCGNDECPSAQSCLRFRAEPSAYQTVEFFAPGIDGVCEEYMDYHDEDERPAKKPRARRRPAARKDAA